MPQTGKPIAYAYSRHSTKKQAKGTSNSRQVDRAELWAAENGYELRHVYDSGRSAYTGENRTLGQLGELEAAMRLKELGPHPVVLIESLDRLTRECIDEAVPFFFSLTNMGAKIVVLTSGRIYQKPLSLPDAMQVLFDLEGAHHYSVLISDRVRKAVNARRSAGKIIHTGSSTPKWLRLNSGRTQWEIIPERVGLIVWMFDEAIAGRGPEAIARSLNAREEPTWTSAKFWRGTTIHSILRGRMVLGEYTSAKPDINPIADYFPAIVDMKRWQMVNDGAVRKAQGRGAGEIKELNLLRGLLVSGLDGSRMILRKSGVKSRNTGQYTWHEYLVSNKTHAGSADSPHRIGYAEVETAILRLFRNLDAKLLTKIRLGSETDHSVRIASAAARVKTLEQKIARINRLIADEDAVPKSTLASLMKLEEEQAEAQRIYKALQQASSKAGDRPQIPTDADITRPEVRRAVRAEIARWCEEIEVFENYCIVWFDQSGLVVHFDGQETSDYRLISRDEANAKNEDEAFEQSAEINDAILTAGGANSDQAPSAPGKGKRTRKRGSSRKPPRKRKT